MFLHVLDSFFFTRVLATRCALLAFSLVVLLVVLADFSNHSFRLFVYTRLWLGENQNA